MGYVTRTDIKDKVLQVTDDDIEIANEHIEDVASSVGVEPENIRITAKVKRLGVVYACYICCLASVGTDGGAVFDGGRSSDIFAQKLSLYREELQRLKADMSVKDFTGNTPGKACISLWRA